MAFVPAAIALGRYPMADPGFKRGGGGGRVPICTMLSFTLAGTGQKWKERCKENLNSYIPRKGGNVEGHVAPAPLFESICELLI